MAKSSKEVNYQCNYCDILFVCFYLFAIGVNIVYQAPLDLA